MGERNEEQDASDFLKRRLPVDGDSNSAGGDPSCGLGGGENVSEESLLKVEKDVQDLAEKVREYREKGPVAFALLLEKSLAHMRSSLPSADTHVKQPAIEKDLCLDKEMLEQRANLMERLASAKASLPTILREIKPCKERLDKAIAARKQSRT